MPLQITDLEQYLAYKNDPNGMSAWILSGHWKSNIGQSVYSALDDDQKSMYKQLYISSEV